MLFSYSQDGNDECSWTSAEMWFVFYREWNTCWHGEQWWIYLWSSHQNIWTKKTERLSVIGGTNQIHNHKSESGKGQFCYRSYFVIVPVLFRTVPFDSVTGGRSTMAQENQVLRTTYNGEGGRTSGDYLELGDPEGVGGTNFQLFVICRLQQSSCPILSLIFPFPNDFR